MKPLRDMQLDAVLSDIRAHAGPTGADRRRISDALRASLGAEAVPHGIDALAARGAGEPLGSPTTPGATTDGATGNVALLADAPSATVATPSGGSSAGAPQPVAGVAGVAHRGFWVGAVIGSGMVMGALGLIVGYGWGRAERLGPPPAAPFAAPAPARGAPSEAALSELAPAIVPRGPEHGAAAGAVARAPSPRPAGATSPKPRAPSSGTGEQRAAANAPAPPTASTPTGNDATAPRGSLSFSEAVERLRKANLALAADKPSLALLQLAELDRGAGEALREEREVTRILAHCALGHTSEARRIARQYRFDEAGSIYARRIARSCADRR